MKFRIKEIKFSEDGAEIVLDKVENLRLQRFLTEIKGDVQNLEFDLKTAKQKRSLEANAYMWVICDKIAKSIRSTKEEVYRKAIREVGVFQMMLVSNEALNETLTRWSEAGDGFFAEVKCESKKNPNCSIVMFYFGSSKYSTQEMSRLIDYLVEEAKGLGIETLTPQELALMKGNHNE